MTTTPAPRVFLASWLDKKMDWRFVYEHRYFILDGTRLSYQLEQHGAERKFGTIISFDPWRESSKADTSKGFCFTVWLLEGGSWALRAATREIYDSWLHALLTVLVSSNSTSAVPSETSSIADGVAPSSGAGAVAGAHFESDGIGRSHVNAAAHPAAGGSSSNRKGRGASPDAREDSTQGDSADASPNTTGASASAPTITAAAIAAAMNAGATSALSEVVLLSSMVEKETAWRGTWKSRYMELREGRHLVIRSSATSKKERQRYVVEAVDPSPLTAQSVWLLFTTSNGDRFWVRYGSVEECQRWFTVCRRLLHAECSWHWLPLAEDDAGRALRLRHVTSSDYSDLHVHYHAAAVVPSFQDGTWAPSLYIFGGSTRWCKQSFNPQARAFLPYVDSAYTTKSLSILQLSGPHVMQTTHPAPFREGPHALVRPLARCGSTMTCVPVELPSPAASAPAAPTMPPCMAARVVLFGGLSSGCYQPPTTELWSVWRSAAACAPGTATQWDRHDLPPYELPMLAFHDAVYVPWRTITGTAAATPSQPAPRGGFMLVTGGLDVEYRCRAECYAVVWRDADSASATGGTADDALRTSAAAAASSTAAAAAGTATAPVGDAAAATAAAPADASEQRARAAAPAAFAFGQLPAPRAFHRTAVLEDGTVVLVGGRGVENAAAEHAVLTLAPEVWQRAAKVWRHTGTAAPEAGSAKSAEEKWCSVSSDDGEDAARAEGGGDSVDSPWLPAHFEASTAPANGAPASSALRLVGALPSEMGDVAVATAGRGNRVVVLGQVSQPSQEVKLYLMDFEPVHKSGRDSHSISAGQQFPSGTRRVRCHEVLLFVGAVPNRVVGVTLQVYNDYLYVIGGCNADKSKQDPYELCGPLRVLLE